MTNDGGPRQTGFCQDGLIVVDHNTVNQDMNYNETSLCDVRKCYRLLLISVSDIRKSRRNKKHACCISISSSSSHNRAATLMRLRLYYAQCSSGALHRQAKSDTYDVKLLVRSHAIRHYPGHRSFLCRSRQRARDRKTTSGLMSKKREKESYGNGCGGCMGGWAHDQR